MDDRVIFHIDVNSAFLSWEAVHRLQDLGEELDLRTENVNMRLEHDEIKFGMMEDFCDIIVRNMDLADTVSTVRTYIFQTEYPAAFKHFTIGY